MQLEMEAEVGIEPTHKFEVRMALWPSRSGARYYQLSNIGSKKQPALEFNAQPRIEKPKLQDLKPIIWPGASVEGIKWPRILVFAARN
jgi:hypothetical protein